ncbi:MAG TPA: DUF3127 domain-containing protein [Bacteroidales bacterium]|nr:DUF3127 domain-containing protein [Bacteroidales bacterium]
MSLEITGRFVQLGQRTSGEGRNGTWTKQELIVETLDQYPRKICFVCWGDLADKVREYNAGDMLKLQFSIESREFNGRWYTDVKPYRLERATDAAPSPIPSNQVNRASASNFEIDPAADDLPF